MALKTRYSPLQQFSVQNLFTAFGELSSPKKLIAMIIVGFAVAVLLFLPIYFLSGKVQSLRKDITTAQKGHSQVVDKILEYQKLKAETDALEGRFGSPAGSLASRVESTAKEAGVNVDQVKEKAPQETDFLGINSLEVKLSNVSLQQLTELLFDLENDKSSPMRVRRLQIKPKFNNRQALDVTFEVATFTLRKES